MSQRSVGVPTYWGFRAHPGFHSTAVDVIRSNMAARQNDLRLYLDVIPDPTKVRRSPSLRFTD